MKGSVNITDFSDFEYHTENGSIFELEGKLCDYCHEEYVDSSSTELPLQLYAGLSGDFWFACKESTISFHVEVSFENNKLLYVKVSKISKKRKVKRV